MNPYNVVRMLKKLSVPPPSVPSPGGRRRGWSEPLTRLVRHWVSSVAFMWRRA
jgi:hypothetical protein